MVSTLKKCFRKMGSADFLLVLFLKKETLLKSAPYEIKH